ncbi:putative cytochrome P450 4p3 [Orchesella cincta]|uniref:Putative cytochrome P450 4p3 n=1 Tax=Orchesella cincta TaxID=48709 RepID=A0A1D2MAF9_ORCCI|nr:putative cytochrome P450 4p3 [Orchesella cincta]
MSTFGVTEMGVGKGKELGVQWFLLTLVSFLLIVHLSQKKKQKDGGDGMARKRIPGPGQYVLGGYANIFALRNTKTSVNVLQQWGAKYGPIFEVQFGPFPVTFLNSPQHLQKLLGSNDTNYLSKGFAYEPLRPFWQDGLIVSSGEKWRSRRKLLTKHMFKYNSVLSFMKIFNRESDLLLSTLEIFYQDGKVKPLEHKIMTFSLNVITEAAVGLSADEVDRMARKEFQVSLIELVEKAKELMCKRILNPLLLFEPIWRLHPLSKLADVVTSAGRMVLSETFRKVENGKPEEKRGMQHVLHQAGVDFDGIFEEEITMISAGYETTASSIHFLLFFLALHPRHQELCREEIDAVFEDGDFCNAQTHLYYHALGQLKHLEMCVLEALRLFPSAFLLMRKIDAELQLEEDLILPANTNVAIFIPGIHKNPNIYPNPEEFIPERFSLKESKDTHNYAYIPFSAGLRKCIGYKFAMMEIMTATAKIIRHFYISTTSKMEDVILLPHITLTLEKPMQFLLTKRKL